MCRCTVNALLSFRHLQNQKQCLWVMLQRIFWGFIFFPFFSLPHWYRSILHSLNRVLIYTQFGMNIACTCVYLINLWLIILLNFLLKCRKAKKKKPESTICWCFTSWSTGLGRVRRQLLTDTQVTAGKVCRAVSARPEGNWATKRRKTRKGDSWLLGKPNRALYIGVEMPQKKAEGASFGFSCPAHAAYYQ